jgi:hypothetical protein
MYIVSLFRCRLIKELRKLEYINWDIIFVKSSPFRYIYRTGSIMFLLSAKLSQCLKESMQNLFIKMYIFVYINEDIDIDGMPQIFWPAAASNKVRTPNQAKVNRNITSHPKIGVAVNMQLLGLALFSGPSRVGVSHLSLEGGNRSSFRNVLFFSVL